MKRRRPIPHSKVPGDCSEASKVVLIDVRDEVAATRDMALALCLASAAPTLPRDERATLGELGALIRGRLAGLLVTLDRLIGDPRGEEHQGRPG